jgi:pimeloyl-ACP methyl ester carboxylesterase
VSTPTSLELPDRARRTTVSCARGTFAALEAFPASGTCELGTALLVPGYTGSKEDFISLLGPLAAAGRRVVAIDMRGQYQTAGPDDPAAYDWPALAADITAVAEATDTTHLLGHSFGGLVTREAVLAGYTPASLTLMSSGPSALPGSRAEDLRAMLAYLADTPAQDLKAKIEEIWHAALEPQAIDSGVTPEILAFLKDRMLSNNPVGMLTMASNLLTAGDKTKALAARDIATMVLYGEDDNAWPPMLQAEMATRMGAQQFCIPGAAHNPNVEAPATTAHALTQFWATERPAGLQLRQPVPRAPGYSSGLAFRAVPPVVAPAAAWRSPRREDLVDGVRGQRAAPRLVRIRAFDRDRFSPAQVPVQ